MSVDELIVGNVGITFWHGGRMWCWKNKEIQKKINISGSAAFILFFYFFHLSATSPLSAMLNWSSAPTLTTTPTVYSAILPCLIKKIYLCNKAVSGRSLQRWKSVAWEYAQTNHKNKWEYFQRHSVYIRQDIRITPMPLRAQTVL